MANKEKFGVCHICGQYKKLSYEHIPPKGSFNPLHQRLYTLDALANVPPPRNLPPWDTSGLQYKSFQKGTGGFTLCEDCNSFTGSKYGEAYSDIVRGIWQELMKIPNDKQKYGVTIHIERANLLAFFKQIYLCSAPLTQLRLANILKSFFWMKTVQRLIKNTEYSSSFTRER